MQVNKCPSCGVHFLGDNCYECGFSLKDYDPLKEMFGFDPFNNREDDPHVRNKRDY
jgi:rRNA maturation protein Nop10